MATQRAKYLFRKRGVYYFERRVPVELSAHYTSPKIVKSLKTKNLNRANKLARQLACKLDDHWASLRCDLFSSMMSCHQTYVATPPIGAPSITIADALSEYLRHRGQGKGDRFQRYAERSVGYLIEFVGTKVSLIIPVLMPIPSDALIMRGLVASSIKRNFEVVRSVFNVAAKEAGLISRIHSLGDPFFCATRQKRKPIPLDDVRKIQRLCTEKMTTSDG